MLEFLPASAINSYHFPDDKVVGKEAFLSMWAEQPVEMWVRAYALTMRELVNAAVAAAKTAPQHFYVDKSQYQAEQEMQALCKELVETPGVDLTIGTSTEGASFIAHSKSAAGADGRCWMGSWNFSESASLQVNDAFKFNSPKWRDQLITAFNRDAIYAWQADPSLQLMPAQPQPRTVASVV